MGFQRFRHVGLVALSYTLGLVTGSVAAHSSSTFTTSLGCIPRYVGDGDCDLQNDTEDCGYDGGDCCECTCVSTEEYKCGEYGGYSCLDPSAPCVDDDDVTVLPSYERSSDNDDDTALPGSGMPCIDDYIADGDCDDLNNSEECGFDGGDCCSCTCISTDLYNCGERPSGGGFHCIDPSASCHDDDDDDDDTAGSFSYDYPYDPPSSDDDTGCFHHLIGDGDCHRQNNNEECGYDGGDCCGCTCDPTIQYGCDLPRLFDCIDPNVTCLNDYYVEAGTKTTVTASANAYETRPGENSSDVGCGNDGCVPALTRDGVTDDMESRWSCSRSVVPGEGPCEIQFTFEIPQDIVHVYVAFAYEEERSRIPEITTNGEAVIRSGSSQPSESIYTSYGLGGAGSEVRTLSLVFDDTHEHDWVNILEVLFLVNP